MARDFQTDNFADFVLFKIYSHFADFQQVKIDPNLTLNWPLLVLDRSVTLLTLGRTLGREKRSKPSPFDKKFKNQAQDLAQVIFNDSVSSNHELGSPVNK